MKPDRTPHIRRYQGDYRLDTYLDDAEPFPRPWPRWFIAALAVGAVATLGAPVRVYPSYMVVAGCMHLVPMTRAATEFINRFDSDEPVKPRRFAFMVPDELVEGKR